MVSLLNSCSGEDEQAREEEEERGRGAEEEESRRERALDVEDNVQRRGGVREGVISFQL